MKGWQIVERREVPRTTWEEGVWELINLIELFVDLLTEKHRKSVIEEQGAERAGKDLDRAREELVLPQIEFSDQNSTLEYALGKISVSRCYQAFVAPLFDLPMLSNQI